MLRRAFERWGLPERLRVDNGHPWGSHSDLPPALALWLLGLGVAVIWNDPSCPEQNGVVERCHGVVQQWVEPWAIADPAQLPPRLEWAVRIQREVYPAVGGRSRREAYPALAVPRRPYRAESEPQMWCLEPIDRHLARGSWRRRVGRSGQVSLYGRDYWVGKAYRGREVDVQFDPRDRHWVIWDPQGQPVRRHPALQLTRERIIDLRVAHRPGE